MQTENRILDDLARVATGALGTLQSVRDDARALIRQQVERLLDEMDLVNRDEFEAVKAMAATARSENETLAKRIARLEAEFGKRASRRKTPVKKAAKDGSTGTAKGRPKRSGR